MSSGSALFGPYIWADPRSEVGKFWDSYGSNWACKLDTITCESLQNNLNGSISSNKLILKGLFAAIQNPIDYVTLRWHYAQQNWIPGFGNSISTQNAVALASFVTLISLILIIVVRKSTEYKFMLLIWLPLILIEISQFLVIHFESRYFISLRLTSASMFLLFLSRFHKQIYKRLLIIISPKDWYLFALDQFFSLAISNCPKSDCKFSWTFSNVGDFKYSVSQSDSGIPCRSKAILLIFIYFCLLFRAFYQIQLAILKSDHIFFGWTGFLIFHWISLMQI